ncbi:hypothetical protein FRC09_020584, partial [Ceratobasidium sp. 395]
MARITHLLAQSAAQVQIANLLEVPPVPPMIDLRQEPQGLEIPTEDPLVHIALIHGALDAP